MVLVVDINESQRITTSGVLGKSIRSGRPRAEPQIAVTVGIHISQPWSPRSAYRECDLPAVIRLIRLGRAQWEPYAYNGPLERKAIMEVAPIFAVPVTHLHNRRNPVFVLWRSLTQDSYFTEVVVDC
jgi:hypothetical protein